MAILTITKGKDYFYYGGSGNAEFHFNKKRQKEWMIGRKREHALAIRGAGISFDHAKISFHGEKYWLEDLQTRGGTYLNDERVKQKVVIPDGATLRFGKAEVRFYYQDPMEGARDVDAPQREHRTTYKSTRSRRRYTQRHLDDDPGVPTHARPRQTEGGRLQKARDELRKVEQERDELKQEIDALKEAQKDVQVLQQSVEARLQTAAEQLAQKTVVINQLAHDNAKLKADLKAEGDRIAAQIVATEARKGQLEKQEMLLKSKVDILESKNRELLDRLTLQKALQAAVEPSGSDERVDELEEKNAQLERALAHAKRRQEELDRELEQARRERDGLASVVASSSQVRRRARKPEPEEEEEEAEERAERKPAADVAEDARPKSLFDGL